MCRCWYQTCWHLFWPRQPEPELIFSLPDLQFTPLNIYFYRVYHECFDKQGLFIQHRHQRKFVNFASSSSSTPSIQIHSNTHIKQLILMKRAVWSVSWVGVDKASGSIHPSGSCLRGTQLLRAAACLPTKNHRHHHNRHTHIIIILTIIIFIKIIIVVINIIIDIIFISISFAWIIIIVIIIITIVVISIIISL